jgi:hypothetical protein
LVNIKRQLLLLFSSSRLAAQAAGFVIPAWQRCLSTSSLNVDLGIFLQIFLDLQKTSCCLEGRMAALICSLTSSKGLVPASPLTGQLE